MLAGVLKKCLLILLVVVVYQNWGKIERLFNPSQVVSEQTQAKANVVLYATEWCGYCKLARRFLDQKGIPYKEFDIEKDAEARKAYEGIGRRRDSDPRCERDVDSRVRPGCDPRGPGITSPPVGARLAREER